MKLTKKQREILIRLREDDDLDLAWSKGGGWWIGNDRTNGKVAHALLRIMLISEDQYDNERFKRFTINSSGRRALEGLPAYRDANGHYHASYAELIAAHRKSHE